MRCPLRTSGTWIARAGVVGATWIIGLSTAPGMAAQETGDPEPRPNYAFATQLGSGQYRSQESTVQIYRLAVGIGLRSVEDHRWGLGLRIPVTLGFYDFDIGSVFQAGLPDGIATVTLAPELHFDVPLGQHWRLLPYTGVGFGRDFSAGRLSFLGVVGLRSRFAFTWGSVALLAGNRFLYAAYTTSELGFSDDYAAFETGLDARHTLGFSLAGHRVDAGLFVADYLYFESPDLDSFVGEPIAIHQQWEVGVTVGTATPWKVVGFEMPRLGVGYRFGAGAPLVRFIIGGPFN